MSYPGSTPMSNSAPPPRPRNKAVIPCVATCGCLLVALIVIVLLGMSAFRSGSATVKQASASAEQFLAALERPDTEAAYALMSQKAQNEKVKASVFDAMEILEKRYGHPRSHSQTLSFYMGTDNGVNTVRLRYQETFEKSSMPVEITLLSEGGQWKVARFDFRP